MVRVRCEGTIPALVPYVASQTDMGKNEISQTKGDPVIRDNSISGKQNILGKDKTCQGKGKKVNKQKKVDKYLCPWTMLVAYTNEGRWEGLIQAIASVFPSAEHRYCVRHIHENMKSQFKGCVYKEMLWNASKAISVGKAKCDLLLNNICEVFNRQLVDGRDQPIITCLEYIREYLMKRIIVVQKVIAKTVGPLTPFVTKLFDAIKKATEYIVQWNRGFLYQVTGPYKDQCVVNMETRLCSCRKWELTGIPCKHVVAAIYNMYENSVNPCNGREMWLVVESRTVITPPLYKPQVGRPPKKRKKTHDEIANESCSS
ncbi:mutator type transposase, partial [Tanacetum coccineum]